jgi:Putative  PD-(D/E)XK family member, (DUF4420)
MEKPDVGLFGIVFSDFPRSTDPNVLNTRNTLFTLGGRTILAGRDFYGRAHLMIPVSDVTDAKLGENLSQGIRVREILETPSSGYSGSGYLDVECVILDSDEVFGAICNDLCREIGNSSTGVADVMARLDATIQKWRNVLKSMATKEPSDSSKIGLIGELAILKALVASEGIKAIDAWVGQDRARHDFEFSSRAIEVKSSTNLTSKQVKIHGTRQLQSAPGSTLALVLLQFEMAQDGLSVSRLVNDLLDAGVNLEALEGRLAEYLPLGCGEFPEWAQLFSLKLVDVSIFSVTTGFPRIDPEALGEALASRVKGIEYTLNLEGLPFTKVEFADFLSLGAALR